MRIVFVAPALALALTAPLACGTPSTSTTAGTDSESTTDATETTGSPGTSSSTQAGTTVEDTTAGSDPSTSGTTTPGTSSPGTTGSPTSTTGTTGVETTGTTSPGTTGGETETGTTGEVWPDMCLSGDIIEGEGANKMEYYGAPCMADADCVPLIGPDAICIPDILGFFDAPGGYCTRPCEQPDGETFETPNHAECKGGGTASCIGANGLFTACAFPCTDSSECHREGYVCRTVPLVDSELKYCLMPDACCINPDGCEF